MQHCHICTAVIIWFILAAHGSDVEDYTVFEDEFQFDPRPDYSQINISDAAWNMTLMRYLNFKENDVNRNLNTSMCHRLSNRFAPKSKPPFGFCEAENGAGLRKMLVLGNNFAINIGEVIYDAFKKRAEEFNILALKGCEVLLQHQPPSCVDEVNYTDVLQTLKPDVIFVISNNNATKEKPNETESIDEDRIFVEQLSSLKELEKFAKKVYILQALPSMDLKKYYLTYTVTPIRKILGQMIEADDKYARLRIKELGKRCKRCEIVDIKPKLTDRKGRYLGFNAMNNLMYLDQWNHLTRFGRNRIKPVFKRLARNFALRRRKFNIFT